MKLVFAGTRGEIKARTALHGMHTSLLVGQRRRRVMIDCGTDWLGRFESLRPDCIVLTHAHPDHAWGLKEGAPCPVYAPRQAWETAAEVRVGERRVVPLREPVEIAGLWFEAFPVEHSIRCPAVGYRISDGRRTIFYCPDVVYINDRAEALRGVGIYIGDGATPTRSMVRRQGGKLTGHAPVRTQLTWCAKEGVPRAIFTHCGSEIVEGEDEVFQRRIGELGAARGVRAEIAVDGLELVLR